MSLFEEHIDFEVLAGKYLSGNILPEEIALLEEQVKNDEQKRQTFIEIKKSWMLVYSSKFKFDESKGWEKISSSIENQQEKPWQLLPLFNNVWRIAATLVLLIVGVYFIYQFAQYREKTLIAESNVIEHVLSDGSKISLNVNSTIKYPAKFKDNERRVKLDGEAYFEIVPDETKTFIVEAHEVEIHVLGTSFYVNARKDNNSVEVSVFSGKVMMITPEGEQIILTAGEKAKYEKLDKIIVSDEIINPNILSWKTRLIIFESTGLKDVFDVVANTYNIDITIRDEALYSCKLTAKFEDRPLEDILIILMNTFDIKYVRSNNKIYVVGEGCK